MIELGILGNKYKLVDIYSKNVTNWRKNKILKNIFKKICFKIIY